MISPDRPLIRGERSLAYGILPSKSGEADPAMEPLSKNQSGTVDHKTLAGQKASIGVSFSCFDQYTTSGMLVRASMVSLAILTLP